MVKHNNCLMYCRRQLRLSTKWCPKQISNVQQSRNPAKIIKPSIFIKSAHSLTLAWLTPLPFSEIICCKCFALVLRIPVKKKEYICYFSQTHLSNVDRSGNQSRKVYDLMTLTQCVCHILNQICAYIIFKNINLVVPQDPLTSSHFHQQEPN